MIRTNYRVQPAESKLLCMSSRFAAAGCHKVLTLRSISPLPILRFELRHDFVTHRMIDYSRRGQASIVRQRITAKKGSSFLHSQPHVRAKVRNEHTRFHAKE